MKKVIVPAASIAAALVTTTLTPALASAESTEQSFLTFNMCGNKCYQGSNDAASDVVRSVTRATPQPTSIMLQEVCRSQFDKIDADLPRHTGYFTTTKFNGCANGEDYGIAVLVKSSSYAVVHDERLGEPFGDVGRERRRLLCLTHQVSGASQPLVSCSTHVTSVRKNSPHTVSDERNRNYQINQVAAHTKKLWDGNKVVVGGDFNAEPTSTDMDAMYHRSYSIAGRGIFREADGDDNAPTRGDAKIDYLFLSRLDFKKSRGIVTDAKRSDHRLLWGWATLT